MKWSGRPTHEYTIRVMKRGTRVQPDSVLRCRYVRAVEVAREIAKRTHADEIRIYRDGVQVSMATVEMRLHWVGVTSV